MDEGPRIGLLSFLVYQVFYIVSETIRLIAHIVRASKKILSTAIVGKERSDEPTF